MKMPSIHILAAGLALALALPTTQAQTPAAVPAKKLTRDELRGCLDSADVLAQRRQSITQRKAEITAEADAIKADQEKLAEAYKRAEAEPKLQEPYRRSVNAVNQRVKALNDKSVAFDSDVADTNKAYEAHNNACGNMLYEDADKEAILKERAGKK